MSEFWHLLRRQSFVFAAVLTLALAVANAIAQPSFIDPANWEASLAVFAPLALAAMASTPAILSGRGGLDISIGPLMNLVSIVFVTGLVGGPLGGPLFAIPILLGLGLAIGTLNGVLVAVLRYQPVIATICMLFVLGGVNLMLAPQPRQAPPNWTAQLAGSIGPLPGGLATVLAVLLVWWLLRRTAFHRTLYFAGGDDATAFSAGINVTAVRILAYAIGGLFAAVGGLALAGLVQSADAGYGAEYVLLGLAAVALGGTPIGGGRGGMLGSLLGAAVIFLIRNLLLSLEVPIVWLQVIYGALLIAGVVFSSVAMARGRTQAAP